jgi:hypothetical protein
MESIVYKNPLYILTKFIRTLPNAKKIIDKYSYELGTERDDMLRNLFEELFNKRLRNIKVDNFMDICAAPGVYSSYLLTKFPDASGMGISLPPEEGGHPFTINNDRYKYIYKNIYNIANNDSKYDVCIASCIPYSVSATNDDEYKIIFTSLIICLNALKSNGTLIINFTFKNVILAINFVYLLSQCFKEIKLFKSKILWILQRTFYVIGYQYQKIPSNIQKYIFDRDFHHKYRDKLLPEIDYKTLIHLLRMFEHQIFQVQIMTFIKEISDSC